MIYTTIPKVQGLLEAGQEYNGTTDLTQFIDAAEELVANIIAYRVEQGLDPASSTTLTKIATWLGAHFYQQSDKGHTRRRTGQREAYMQIQVGKGLDSTLYGQTAILLDNSGYLRDLNSEKSGAVIVTAWLGKRPTEQTPVWNRQ